MKTALFLFFVSASAYADGFMWNNEFTKCYKVEGPTQMSRSHDFNDVTVDKTFCERDSKAGFGVDSELQHAQISCPGALYTHHLKIPSNEAFGAVADHIRNGDFSYDEFIATWQSKGCEKHPNQTDDEAFRDVLKTAAGQHGTSPADATLKKEKSAKADKKKKSEKKEMRNDLLNEERIELLNSEVPTTPVAPAN